MLLTDNTLYLSTLRKEEETRYKKVLPAFKSKKDSVAFLKYLSSHTIQELNEDKKEEGGILVWPHSFKKEDDRDDLKDMKVVECVERDNKIESLRTGNLVGFVGNGKVQLEINSRFSHNQGKQEQDYFLYYMLSKVFHMNIVNMEVGGGSLKELDLLIFMFPRLLQEAMRQGLFKVYVKREYNDSNVRGTIDVNRHLRFNYPANGRIAYRTREYSYDNHVTQLIRHTIEHISKLPMGPAILTGNKEMEECVKHIIQSTPSYQKGQRRQVIADNRKVVSHPYFTKYKELQRICLAILRHERISHGAQSDKVHGVLIDAAWLWEEYLAIVLHDVGFKHHTSKTGFHLFKEDTQDDRELFQKVIPDYVHTNNYVADAKYIPLDYYRKMDAERAAAVYYKTIMYMYLKATPKGFLFYPYKGETNETSETKVETYEINNNRNCFIHKVGLIVPSAKDANYSDFCQQMQESEASYQRKIQDILE